MASRPLLRLDASIYVFPKDKWLLRYDGVPAKEDLEKLVNAIERAFIEFEYAVRALAKQYPNTVAEVDAAWIEEAEEESGSGV